MVDKILLQDQGITYGLFSPETEAAPADDEEEEGAEKKVKQPEAEKLPRHILIDEVVEEPRIYFYSVPKLGSYLAIKMEYDSCLSEEAFDAAVVDFQEVELKSIE